MAPTEPADVAARGSDDTLEFLATLTWKTKFVAHTRALTAKNLKVLARGHTRLAVATIVPVLILALTLSFVGSSKSGTEAFAPVYSQTVTQLRPLNSATPGQGTLGVFWISQGDGNDIVLSDIKGMYNHLCERVGIRNGTSDCHFFGRLLHDSESWSPPRACTDNYRYCVIIEGRRSYAGEDRGDDTIHTTTIANAVSLGTNTPLQIESGHDPELHFLQIQVQLENECRKLEWDGMNRVYYYPRVDELVREVEALDLNTLPRLSTAASFSPMAHQEDLVILILVLSVVTMAVVASSWVSTEKDIGVLHLMRTLGMLDSAYWVSWHSVLTGLAAVMAAALTVVMYSYEMPMTVHVNPMVYFFGIFFFQVSVVAMALAFIALANTTRGLNAARAAVLVCSVVPVFMIPLFDTPIYDLYNSGSPDWLHVTMSILSPGTAFASYAHVVRRQARYHVANELPVVGMSEMSERFQTKGEVFFGKNLADFQDMGFRAPSFLENPLWRFADEVNEAPSPSMLLMAMLLPAVVYWVLAWYFLQLQGHSLFFFATPEYWGFAKPRPVLDGVLDTRGTLQKRSRDTGSIELRKVSKTWDKGPTAVKEVTLSMRPGEVLALLGQNGAGKSTLIKMLTGETAPTNGDVFIAGYDVRDSLSDIQRLVGVCPQDDVLWPELTAREHLNVIVRLKGLHLVPHLDADEEITNMLQRSMGARLDAFGPSSAFSGGMKRTLQLAMALIQRPKIVFLDEPTTGMDPMKMRATWRVIEEAKSDAVVVLTTHDMQEADVLGDIVAIIAMGRVRAHGTPTFLKHRFGNGTQLSLLCHKTVETRDDVIPILSAIKQVVPAGTIQAPAKGVLHVAVPPASARRLPDLFRWIESDGSSVIDSWSVGGTTMQEIFLRVAVDKQVIESDDADGSNGLITPCQLCGIQESEDVVLYTPGHTAVHVSGVLCLDCANDRTPGAVSRAQHEAHSERLAPSGAAAAAAAAGGLGAPDLAVADSWNTPLLDSQQQAHGQLDDFDNTQGVSSSKLGVHGRTGGATSQFRGIIGKQFSSARSEKGLLKCNLCCQVGFILMIILSGLLPSPIEPGYKRLARSILGSVVGQPTHRALAIIRESLDRSRDPNDPDRYDQTNRVNTRSYSIKPELFLASRFYTADWDASLVAPTKQRQLRALRLTVPEHPPPSFTDSTSSEMTHSELYQLPPRVGVTIRGDLDRGRVFNVSMVLAEVDQGGGFAQRRYTYMPLWAADYSHRPGTRLMYYSSHLAQYLTTRGETEAKGAHPSQVIETTALETTWDLPFVFELLLEFRHRPMIGLMIDNPLQVQVALPVVLITAILLPSMAARNARDRESHMISQLRVAGVPPLLFWTASFLHDTAIAFAQNIPLLVFGYFFDILRFQEYFFLLAGLLLFWAVQQVSFAFLVASVAPSSASISIGMWLLNVLGMALAMTLVMVGNETSFELGKPAMWIPHVPFLTAFVIAAGDVRDLPAFRASVTMMTISSALYAALALVVQVVRYSALWRQVKAWYFRSQVSSFLKGHHSRREELFRQQRLDTEAAAGSAGAAKHVVALDGSLDDSVREEREQALAGRSRDAIASGEQALAVQALDLDVVYSGASPYLAVDQASLALEYGECFGLLGPNGAGKTTLLKVFGGEQMHAAGFCKLAGFDAETERDHVRGQLGVCPQHDRYWDELTVYDHLLCFVRIKGYSRKLEEVAVLALAEEVGLDGDSLTSKASDLSGGQRRRLSIAMSLVGGPRIWILDEPTTGLDPETKKSIWKLVQSQKASGRCVLVTTHSMAEADALCSRIAIMAKSRVRVIGTQLDLKTRYGSGYLLTLGLRRLDANQAGASTRQERGARLDELAVSLHPKARRLAFVDGVRVSYELPNDTKGSLVFDRMEDAKERFAIREWNLASASLTDVFENVVLAAEAEKADLDELAPGAAGAASKAPLMAAQRESRSASGALEVQQF